MLCGGAWVTSIASQGKEHHTCMRSLTCSCSLSLDYVVGSSIGVLSMRTNRLPLWPMCCPSNRTNLACIIKFASVRTVKEHHDDQNDRPRLGPARADRDDSGRPRPPAGHQETTRSARRPRGPQVVSMLFPKYWPRNQHQAQMLSPALAGFRRSRERGQNASPKYSNP